MIINQLFFSSDVRTKLEKTSTPTTISNSNDSNSPMRVREQKLKEEEDRISQLEAVARNAFLSAEKVIEGILK